MNKERNHLQITKPILIFCIILILFILMSCSKSENDKVSLNVNKNNTSQKTLIDKAVTSIDEQNEVQVQTFDKNNKNNNEVSKYFESDNRFDDLSNIKNTYYGKYNLHGEEVFGSFEVTRNSVIFTPDDGNSKEIIHFSGIRNIDRREYPSGKIDLLFQYDGHEKIIKNVSDEMFSDVLLYKTK